MLTVQGDTAEKAWCEGNEVPGQITSAVRKQKDAQEVGPGGQASGPIPEGRTSSSTALPPKSSKKAPPTEDLCSYT